MRVRASRRLVPRSDQLSNAFRMLDMALLLCLCGASPGATPGLQDNSASLVAPGHAANSNATPAIAMIVPATARAVMRSPKAK